MKPYPALLIALSIACRSDDTIKSSNSNPTITITSHSEGEELLQGYEILFGATVGDLNHSLSELSVVWSTNARNVCEAAAPDAEGLSLCPVQLEEGENLIRAQVTDPDGAAGLDTVEFNLVPTFAPVVELLSPVSDERYYSDQLILFSANITDNEDSPADLAYTWTSSLDGAISASAIPNEDGLLEEYLNLTEGEHALTLTVTDRSNKSTSQSTIVTLVGPILHRAVLLTPLPQEMFSF